MVDGGRNFVAVTGIIALAVAGFAPAAQAVSLDHIPAAPKIDWSHEVPPGTIIGKGEPIPSGCEFAGKISIDRPAALGGNNIMLGWAPNCEVEVLVHCIGYVSCLTQLSRTDQGLFQQYVASCLQSIGCLSAISQARYGSDASAPNTSSMPHTASTETECTNVVDCRGAGCTPYTTHSRLETRGYGKSVNFGVNGNDVLTWVQDDQVYFDCNGYWSIPNFVGGQCNADPYVDWTIISCDPSMNTVGGVMTAVDGEYVAIAFWLLVPRAVERESSPRLPLMQVAMLH